MQIGLKRGTVIVESHKIEWEISAQKMINNLKTILKDDMIDAQHIGSTAIKNICAKPIVDIVVGVSSFDRIIKHNDNLMKNGIVYQMQYPLGQYLYVVGDLEKNIWTHYIHVVIWGQEAWNNYINMRDFLNTHEKEAQEYSTLKECLAKKYPEDRSAYTNAKSEFIEKILLMAAKWRERL
jgi:GrpB-like predicted nucleotidyltransferase (UPF0157 family)